jgi:hypothetical protein
MSKPIYRYLMLVGRIIVLMLIVNITFIEAWVQQVRVIEPDIVRPFE